MRRVLSALAAQCQSARAAARALRLPELGSQAAADQRLDMTAEALRLHDADLQPALEGDLDHRGPIAMAERGGVLDGEALRAIGMALRCATTVRAGATAWAQLGPGLAMIAAELPKIGLLADVLADAFDDRGELLDDASPELKELRDEVRRRARGLRSHIEAMVKDSDREGLLQDDYYTVRDGRFVLPVKAADKRVVGGIVHGSSQTGQTVYIEPREMVQANNALTLAADAVKREERLILGQFSAMVASHGDAIERSCVGLVELDSCFALARLALALHASRPTIEALSDGLTLRSLRHPQLVIDGAEVVANDIEVRSPARWLVVTGPNGGGKTVLLTAVALAFEMLRRGMYVCAADGSAMPWVDRVQLVVGDAQDLESGHSTFSGHLARLGEAMAAVWQSEGGVVVLLDELASGTEPLAGSAIARAVLEELADRGSIGLVATHYEALKLLPLHDTRFANASLTLHAKTLAPTFELRVGTAGSSSPLALAERMGLPASVVERARGLLGTGSGATEEMLERLQRLTRQAEADSKAAAYEREQAVDARRRLQEQREFEKKAAAKRIDAAADLALTDIRKARELAKFARKRLREQALDIGIIEHQAAELGQAERAVRAVRSNPSKTELDVRRKPLAANEITPGAMAWHSGLRTTVQVLELDARKGRVRVRAGVMELDAKPEQLLRAEARELPTRPVPKAAAPPPTSAETFDDDDTTSFRTPEWTCDLRGMRAQEALGEVDRYLDRGVVAGRRGLCIVHGMGTGALRNAVEQHLQHHAQVARSRLGESGEGGAGATMVWLVS